MLLSPSFSDQESNLLLIAELLNSVWQLQCETSLIQSPTYLFTYHSEWFSGLFENLLTLHYPCFKSCGDLFFSLFLLQITNEWLWKGLVLDTTEQLQLYDSSDAKELMNCFIYNEMDVLWEEFIIQIGNDHKGILVLIKWDGVRICNFKAVAKKIHILYLITPTTKICKQC